MLGTWARDVCVSRIAEGLALPAKAWCSWVPRTLAFDFLTRLGLSEGIS